MLRSVRIAIAATMATAIVTLGAGTQAAKPETWVGRLVIANPNGTEGILHDCVDESGTPVAADCAYTDYRWPSSPDSRPDPCVLGDVYSTGLGFFALDRNFANGLRCTQQPDAENLGYALRRFAIRISDDRVCNWFYSGLAPCTVTTSQNPIIRAETVFKNKATKTKVGFIWGWDGDGRAYRINTLQDAPFTGTTNLKLVTYSGPVTIFNVAGTMPEYTFQLAFTLLIERRAL